MHFICPLSLFLTFDCFPSPTTQFRECPLPSKLREWSLPHLVQGMPLPSQFRKCPLPYHPLAAQSSTQFHGERVEGVVAMQEVTLLHLDIYILYPCRVRYNNYYGVLIHCRHKR